MCLEYLQCLNLVKMLKQASPECVFQRTASFDCRAHQPSERTQLRLRKGGQRCSKERSEGREDGMISGCIVVNRAPITGAILRENREQLLKDLLRRLGKRPHVRHNDLPQPQPPGNQASAKPRSSKGQAAVENGRDGGCWLQG